MARLEIREFHKNLQKVYKFFSHKFSQSIFFCIFFGGLECVGHSLAYVAHFVFLRDV
jgi:hypothetical protein